MKRSSFKALHGRHPDDAGGGASPGAIMLRVWLAGAGILAVVIAGVTVLIQIGFFATALFFAVLCGLALIFMSLRFGDGEYFIAAFCGLVIGVGASITGQDEIVLFGSGARDVVAATAPGSDAAFFHFRNARVLADRSTGVDVWGGTRGQGHHVVYQLQVAPIVDDGWTEEQSVAALAVIGSPVLGHHSSEWRAPLNGGARLGRTLLPEKAKAVRNLVRFEHLTIAPNAVFLRWSADPEGQAARARGRVVTACLIALALWTVAVLVNRYIVMRRRAATGAGRRRRV